MNEKITYIELILLLICFIGIVITIIDFKGTDVQIFWLTITIPSFLTWLGVTWFSWPNFASFQTYSPLWWRMLGAGFATLFLLGIIASIGVQFQENNIETMSLLGATSALLASLRIASLAIYYLIRNGKKEDFTFETS